LACPNHMDTCFVVPDCQADLSTGRPHLVTCLLVLSLPSNSLSGAFCSPCESAPPPCSYLGLLGSEARGPPRGNRFNQFPVGLVRDVHGILLVCWSRSHFFPKKLSYVSLGSVWPPQSFFVTPPVQGSPDPFTFRLLPLFI